MSTPPVPPSPNQEAHGGPFPPGDPRNTPYGNAPYAPYNVDPRLQREQERAWASAQREQVRTQRQQQKVWRDYQRGASRQQARAMRQQVRMASEAQRAQLRAWRRSNRAQSIIGPLLLIAIASLALLVYNGQIPFPLLFNGFARWWPLILIAAGVLRLVEWAIARHQSEASGVPVRFAIGGGTVWLLILVSVLGLAAQGGIHHVGNAWNFGWNGQDLNHFFGSKHEEDAAAVTHTIAADGTLEIHNERGDVTVDGTSDDGLVHVSEHKEIFTSDDSRVSSLMRALDPQFSGTDADLVLRTSSSENSSAALTLTVPRGVHVVLNSSHGDVAVHSFHAPVAINADHGDVDLSAIAGDVQVRTNSRHADLQVHSVQGSVQIAGSGSEVNLDDIQGPVGVNGDFFGSGRLQHVTGAVTYNAGRISFTAQRVDGEVSFDSDDEFTARGVAGPVTVRTRSRNITLDRVSGDLHVANSSGHVDITAVAPAGSINVENRDGDVSLSLPGSAKFTLAAETSDGSIQSDFPGVSGSTNQSHHGSLTTTVGVGGPSIRLTTTHGNIALQRNDQAPLPPMPPLPPALTNVPVDVRQALQDAQKEIAAARREATHDHSEGEQVRKQALAEADQALRQMLVENDKALKTGQQQTEQVRRDAQQLADQARKEAQREIDQAHRQTAHATEPPASPAPPQNPQ